MTPNDIVGFDGAEVSRTAAQGRGTVGIVSATDIDRRLRAAAM